MLLLTVRRRAYAIVGETENVDAYHPPDRQPATWFNRFHRDRYHRGHPRDS